MTVTTEEALFGSIDIYRLIVDSAEEGIWIADRDDRVTFINNKLINLLGYGEEEIIGKPIYDFADQSNRALMIEFLVYARKGTRNTYPVKLCSKSGKHTLLLVSSTPMFDKNGNYLGVLELCSDMSSQLEVEELLRATKKDAELYVDVMSHDINNMQQVALGYLEMAKSQLRGQGKLEMKDEELINKPIEVLENVTQLIMNIKSLQKEKLGRLKDKTIDVNNLLTEVKGLFSSTVGRNITINYDPPPGGYLVRANDLLKEVFINLGGNAVKHSTGSLVIDILLDRVTENGRGYCRITIEDNGPGIPDVKKRQIFERLTPGEVYSSASGIGLYLINTLIGDFNGRIWVEDRVQGDHTKGARFVVMLPAVEK